MHASLSQQLLDYLCHSNRDTPELRTENNLGLPR